MSANYPYKRLETAFPVSRVSSRKGYKNNSLKVKIYMSQGTTSRPVSNPYLILHTQTRSKKITHSCNTKLEVDSAVLLMLSSCNDYIGGFSDGAIDGSLNPRGDGGGNAAMAATKLGFIIKLDSNGTKL